jgi:predicted Zn-dependent peptidase
VIKEELAMYLDQPQHRVQELLNETLWPGQPLGRPLTGTPATLDRLDRARLVDYQRGNYVADRTVIAAAGRLRHERVVKAVSRLARHFPQGRTPQFAPAVSRQRAPNLSLFTKDTEQTQLALGIRACSRHDPRRYALRLLNTILGENMSSRLFQVIREDRGLAYSIYSSPGFFADAGTLTISAGLDPGNLRQTLQLIMGELRRLRATAPAPAELRRARDYAIGQIDLSLESTDSQMMWLGEQIIGYGRTTSPEAIKRHIQRVKAAEIRAVARDFFRPESLNLALVSPRARDKGLRNLLKL